MSEENKEKDEELKSISVTPALTALFKPTADYLGGEIRGYVKETVEEWKNKRQEKNLMVHMEAVQKALSQEPVLEKPEDSSIAQLSFFDEWIDNVKDIDPADEELSTIWQKLLENAARGKSTTPEIVESLKYLTPREAKFISDISRRVLTFTMLSGMVAPEEKYLAKKLEQKNILEKNYAVSVLIVCAIAMIIYFAYFIVSELNILPSSKIIVVLPAAMCIGLGLGRLFGPGFTRWSVTWLGIELISLSKK